MAFNVGDLNCTSGLSKRIYDQLISDTRNGVGPYITTKGFDTLKAQAYAIALGVGNEIDVEGGLGGGAWSPVDGRTVAYWPLDEDAGSGAFDHAGQFFLQEDTPSATTRPGVGAGVGPSSARSFNGTTDGLCWKPGSSGTVSESGPLYLTSLGSWTLDAWVWMDPAGSGGTVAKWSGWGTNTSGSGARLVVQPTQIQVEWLYGGGSPVAVDATYTGTISTGAWHCVQVRKTWDPVASTAKVEIFLDNVLVSTTMNLHNCEGNYGWRVSVGKDGGYSLGWWRGRIQMLRFSRGARSNSELSDFYTQSQLL